jgi:hypothetical protein
MRDMPVPKDPCKAPTLVQSNTFGRRLTTGCNYDHKIIINKLIIDQDVILREPITRVRRHIDDLK